MIPILHSALCILRSALPSLYSALARGTVLIYAAMAVAALCAGQRRQAAIAALFSLANALIFEVF